MCDDGRFETGKYLEERDGELMALTLLFLAFILVGSLVAALWLIYEGAT